MGPTACTRDAHLYSTALSLPEIAAAPWHPRLRATASPSRGPPPARDPDAPIGFRHGPPLRAELVGVCAAFPSSVITSDRKTGRNGGATPNRSSAWRWSAARLPAGPCARACTRRVAWATSVLCSGAQRSRRASRHSRACKRPTSNGHSTSPIPMIPPPGTILVRSGCVSSRRVYELHARRTSEEDDGAARAAQSGRGAAASGRGGRTAWRASLLGLLEVANR